MMAHTGKFCIFGDDGRRAGTIGRAFEKFVCEHPFLKNLSWLVPPQELSEAPCLVTGECDGLTPDVMRSFLNGREVGGVRVLAVHGAYRERWEEVL